MKQFLSVLILALLTLPMTGTAAAQGTPIPGAPPPGMVGHIQARLYAVGGSGVGGSVSLMQRPNNQGTSITVVAFGLQPKHSYVSLYYSNHTCQLEPYSPSDVIGAIYKPSLSGIGITRGNVDDNLDDINSVSVRVAGTFTLLACADVHPM